MSATDGQVAVALGPARVGRRTKDLAKRLRPGEIAVIDHLDIDRVAADALLEAGVAGVVNAAPSISGRYPNGGPIRIVSAGVPLLDAAGHEVMEQVRDGEIVALTTTGLRRNGELIATGELLTLEVVQERMKAARDSIGDELERFAVNTLEYIEREARHFFEPLRLPDLRTQIAGRHALVVVRGHDYREDLRHLKPYIREYRPVLIAVDGGADALLEVGLKPDMIVGDFDSLSERALNVGAELVAHSYPDGRSPARSMLEARGLEHHEISVDGISEDLAMLLAYEAGASLIVAVGTHSGMVEFLDKGRAGMSSTFLTRLRIGPMLVDAKGVSRLYEGRVRRADILLLVCAALVAMLAIVLASEPLRAYLEGFWLEIRNLWYSFTDRL